MLLNAYNIALAFAQKVASLLWSLSKKICLAVREVATGETAASGVERSA